MDSSQESSSTLVVTSPTTCNENASEYDAQLEFATKVCQVAESDVAPQKVLRMLNILQDEEESFGLDFGVPLNTAHDLHSIATILATVQQLSDNDPHTRGPITVNFLKQLIVFLQVIHEDYELLLSVVYVCQNVLPKFLAEETIEVLIDVCEFLLTSDEGIVKTETLALVSSLVDCMSQEQMDTHFVAFVDRMYANEWFRCTGIDLMALSYRKVSEKHKSGFRSIYKGLIDDESTLAKSAMARNYSVIISTYDQQLLETECVDMLEMMVADIQVSVRQYAVETAVTLAGKLTEDQVDKCICCIFEKMAADNSWKVRLEVANQIVDIQRAVRPKLARIVLINILRTQCNDIENIVRKCLARKMVHVLIHFKQTSDINLDEFFEVINELNRDPVDDVRDALMDNIMLCTSVLRKDELSKYLLPLMKNTLMCQSITGVRTIAERCVANLNKLISILGYQVLEHEIEKFMFDVLTGPCKWRTRRYLVMTIHIIAQNTEEEYFTKNCLIFYKKLLNDSCHAVRRIAPMILPGLLGKYGFVWGRKKILNWVFSFHQHPSYLQRFIVLYAIDEIIAPSLNKLDTSRCRKSILQALQISNMYKIFSLSQMLSFKLMQFEESPLETTDMASDLVFYGEEIAEDFQEYPVVPMELVDLLQFILKYVLPILSELLHDPISNIQQRARMTFSQLCIFNETLKQHLDSETLNSPMDNYTREDKLAIESSIMLELAEPCSYMDQQILHPIKGKKFDHPKSTVSSYLEINNVSAETVTLPVDEDESKLFQYGLKETDHGTAITDSVYDGKGRRKSTEEDEHRKALEDTNMALFDGVIGGVAEFYDLSHDSVDI